MYPIAESSIAFVGFHEPSWEIDPDSLSVSPKLVAFRPVKVTATDVAVEHEGPPDVVVVVDGRVEVASVVVDAPVQMPLPGRADVG